jgi:hypothetical protein
MPPMESMYIGRQMLRETQPSKVLGHSTFEGGRGSEGRVCLGHW